MKTCHTLMPEHKEAIDDVIKHYGRRAIGVRVTNLQLIFPHPEEVLKLANEYRVNYSFYMNKREWLESDWKENIINYDEIDKAPYTYFKAFIEEIVFRTKVRASFFFTLVDNPANRYTVNVSVVEPHNQVGRPVDYSWFNVYVKKALCSPRTWGCLSDHTFNVVQPLEPYNYVTFFPIDYCDSIKTIKIKEQEQQVKNFIEQKIKKGALPVQLPATRTPYLDVILSHPLPDELPETKAKPQTVKKAVISLTDPSSRFVNPILRSSYKYHQRCLEFSGTRQEERVRPATRLRVRLGDYRRIRYTDAGGVLAGLYIVFLQKLLILLDLKPSHRTMNRLLKLIDIEIHYSLSRPRPRHSY